MPTRTSEAPEPLGLTAPVKLRGEHRVDGFCSGEPSIDNYLKGAAKGRHAVVYVTCFKGTADVAGFYTLSNACVARELMPRKTRHASPAQHPVTLLGRMGVDLRTQGRGVATDLLKDAIERSLVAAQSVASVGMIVHSLNEALQAFYAKRAGFVRLPGLSAVTMFLSFSGAVPALRP